MFEEQEKILSLPSMGREWLSGYGAEEKWEI